MPDNLLEKTGAAIKAARQQTGMTQKELAKTLHITPQHLGAIENGRQKPGYDLLCAIVYKLALPMDDIFYPDKPHNRKELEEVVTMLHYCDDHELSVVSAALHAIMKLK